MAKYQAGPGGFYSQGRLYRAGESFSQPDEKTPHSSWIPVDDAAKAAVAKKAGKAAPAKAPVAPPKPVKE